MIKDCLKKETGFVIVYKDQSISDDSSAISKKGSYVEIIDFNNLPNGLLGITVKSINKVEIKDLCGAGDTFIASLCVKFLKTRDIRQSMIFANECATKVVQSKGVNTVNEF